MLLSRKIEGKSIRFTYLNFSQFEVEFLNSSTKESTMKSVLFASLLILAFSAPAFDRPESVYVHGNYLYVNLPRFDGHQILW